ncbi:glycosyltransferase [Flavobacterium ovatum]|uniref:glycosyltransferase n=1 Tax=Flavobacterium ovatum TaxID=1928857 RepID=UPI00344D439E
MKFAIITHVPHIHEENQYYAYAPYVREMNIWEKYVDEITIVAPLVKKERTAIECVYKHPIIKLKVIPDFDVLSIVAVLKTVLKLPKLIWIIFQTMRQTDHIHLRCPGNVGLLACFVQILFPNKIKTAKYAGNWDPKSKQPWSYCMQKWILNNSFLTRNMQVLVYGEWQNQSKNIKPFFTATYSELEKTTFVPKESKSKINFVFVGTLVKGKNPLYAIQLVERLHRNGYNVYLDLYGEGVERSILEKYISDQQLDEFIQLRGNQKKEVLKTAYQQSHFVVLPSLSEGWPKAIAEGMFWGCVPLATNVSCIPNMLEDGRRGVILKMNLDYDSLQVKTVLENQNIFDTKSCKALEWSQKYTLEIFENEIKKIIHADSSTN